MKTLVILIFSLFPVIAWADKTGPCRYDGPKFCPNVSFGKGDMFRCLLRYRNKVSVVCGNHLDDMIADRTECQDDFKKLCAKEVPSKRLACMQSKRDQLSNACRTDLGLND